MNIDDNLQLISAMVFLSISWFGIDIGRMKKSWKIKMIYTALLGLTVFIIFSIVMKDISIWICLMILTMAFFIVGMYHFLDNHADTYGQIDILAFLKKKKKAPEEKNPSLEEKDR